MMPDAWAQKMDKHHIMIGSIRLMACIDDTHTIHSDVWHSVEKREKIKRLFLNNGTDALLFEGDSGWLKASCLAACVMMLEKYNPRQHNNPMSALEKDAECMRNRDVFEGCEHSLLEFYSKRIPCSCLDEMNAAIKSKAKTGVCHHCSQRKESRTLMVCTACQNYQYCSRECQKAAWHSHKGICKKLTKRRML